MSVKVHHRLICKLWNHSDLVSRPNLIASNEEISKFAELASDILGCNLTSELVNYAISKVSPALIEHEAAEGNQLAVTFTKLKSKVCH